MCREPRKGVGGCLVGTWEQQGQRRRSVLGSGNCTGKGTEVSKDLGVSSTRGGLSGGHRLGMGLLGKKAGPYGDFQPAR